MAWETLKTERGWTLYWENKDGRLYARGGGNVVTGKSQHDFHGRYHSASAAMAAFDAWVRSSR